MNLPIDWEEATTDILAIFNEYEVSPPEDFWDTFEAVDGTAYREAAEATLAGYERDAAQLSERLTLVDALADARLPVGVCSLNCEAACRIALKTHGVESAVECVVGRDTVPVHKPDPEPLLHTVNQLSATPEDTLFVGDTAIDERTAMRAGTEFEYVDEIVARYTRDSG